MSNAFLIMGLTRRVSKFNEDRKNNVVSVATLDNIREICFHVSQIFDISIDTKDNIQKRIKRVLNNRGHVCNRYKDSLANINKLIYSII